MPCLLDVYKANISNMMNDKSAIVKKQLEEVLTAIEGIKTTIKQEVHNQTAGTSKQEVSKIQEEKEELQLYEQLVEKALECK